MTMSFGDDKIHRKSPAEIEKMRCSGHIVRQVLDHLKGVVAPGVTTMDLEKTAEGLMAELGAKPAFKGYYGYPCVLCTSVNEEIVHGIPSEKRVLKQGDIVSIDCGVVFDGYYGDAAITVPVGDTLTPELKKLLEVTEASLYIGIEQAKIGNTVGHVGVGDPEAWWKRRLQRSQGICRAWYRNQAARSAADSELRQERPGPGMIGRHGAGDRADGEFGRPGVKVLSDKWTAVTVDGSYSAHFEHSVAVTKQGPMILTN